MNENINEKIRAHVIVRGLVQGVFFRAHTRVKAKELGIRGWVKNLPDGKVEAIFEGERDKVQEIIEWAREGPPAAQVKGLDLEWQEHQEEFDNFDIKYF